MRELGRGRRRERADPSAGLGLPPAGPRPPPAPGLSKMEGAPRAPLALRLLFFAALPATGWLTTGTLEPPLLPPAPKVGLGGRESAGILGEKPGPGTWDGSVRIDTFHLPAGRPWTGGRAPKGLGMVGRSTQGNGGGGDEGGDRVKGNL